MHKLDNKRIGIYGAYILLGSYIVLVSGNFWQPHPRVVMAIVNEKIYMFVALVAVYLIANSIDVGLAVLVAISLFLTLFDIKLLSKQVP